MSHTEPSPFPDVVPIGVDGVLVRFAAQLDDTANRAMLRFARALEGDTPKGVVEVSTTLVSAYLRFDADTISRAALTRVLTGMLDRQDWFAEDDHGVNRLWHVPVAFGEQDGPQLGEVAELTGLTPEAVIDELVQTPVRVLAIGFAPGQPYLGMLPDRWDIPRQTALTPTVPAGALVVAVRQLVLFTAPAPTGWRQVGRTAFRTFRPDSDTPIPLLPGDIMRFHPISGSELAQIERSNTDGSGGARLEILS